MKGFLAALLLSTPLLANATTWTDVIDFNPDPHITPYTSFSYTHDITDNGFNPNTDTATKYDLTLYLTNSGRDWFDVVFIDQPGLSLSDLSVFSNWTYESATTHQTYQGLLSLNNDGKLDVTVESVGSFYLDASELAVTGKSGANVPEPTSLALLAAGMIGIVAMRRLASRAS